MCIVVVIFVIKSSLHSESTRILFFSIVISNERHLLAHRATNLGLKISTKINNKNFIKRPIGGAWMIKIHRGQSHPGLEQSPKRGNVRPGLYKRMNAPFAFRWDSVASHNVSFARLRLHVLQVTRLI